MLLRLLEGGRVSLAIGVAAAMTAAARRRTAVGLASRAISAAGPTRVLMRLADGVIALPLLPLLMVLAALDLHKLGGVPRGRSRTRRGPASSASSCSPCWSAGRPRPGWCAAQRSSRGSRDFVRAARSLGAGTPHILWRHILPNVMAPLVVATTLSVGDVILLESVLSFLGLGIQPPLASWGTMLSNAQELITSAPSLAIYPGMMIFLTVIACNLLGDALLARFDPRDPARA